ncbi:penicillin-binding protein [Isobaculum melis]|uniref:Penicillin-binding protein 2B n=1 Tax=Isobaculum melis TaxID=142588 RepID=A0A1H9T727_9LACT|nr:penicillin-binding protein [Isobaculum melis]SER92948.1 penicillin-binding protein 2B [Isobaculum melis]
MKMNRNPHKNRKQIGMLLFGVCIISFIAFMARFSYIMLVGKVNGEVLAERANKQYSGSSVLSAKRGSIFDSDGQPVAEESTSYSLYAVLDEDFSKGSEKPLHVKDKEKTAEALGTALDIPKEEVLATLNQENKFQVEFGQKGANLSLGKKLEIEALKLPGVYFEETPTRLYSHGVFASHLIGFTQTKEESTELEGVMGIEKAYNDLLKGTDGKKAFSKDKFGYLLPNSKEEITEPKDGHDIYLTIDTRIQSYLETLMTNVNEEYHPENLQAMMVKAKTGEIVAMSQRPSFNSATKEGIDDKWGNMLVEEPFEPGSTMKVFTIAAAMEAGVFNPNATYQSGSIQVEDQVIRDYNKYGWGTISYLEGFQHSSNVAFVKLMQQMGPDTWLKYMQDFGLGKSTNSGLPNEQIGEIRYDYPADRASTAFGQAITVTPYQMMQGFTAIANDGKMMKLHYIKKTVDPNTGEETVTEPEVIGQPVSAATANQDLAYMKTVVETPGATATPFHIDGESVAAKTGTAEIVGKDGKYMTGEFDYVHSVVGMAPAENPEYILYITMRRPTTVPPGQSAPGILKEIFNPVMKLALQYSKVSEESGTEEKEVTMPKVTGGAKGSVIQQIQGLGLDVSVVGDGDKIVQQLPMPDETVLKNQKIVLLTDQKMTMPNVSGWSKKDVLKISEITGIQFKFEGDGYVVEQSLPEGQPLTGDSDVTIRLEKK